MKKKPRSIQPRGGEGFYLNQHGVLVVRPAVMLLAACELAGPLRLKGQAIGRLIAKSSAQ